MGPKLILGNPMNDRGGIHDHGIVHIPSDKGLGFLAPHKNRDVKPLTRGSLENLALDLHVLARTQVGVGWRVHVDRNVPRKLGEANREKGSERAGETQHLKHFCKKRIPS